MTVYNAFNSVNATGWPIRLQAGILSRKSPCSRQRRSLQLLCNLGRCWSSFYGEYRTVVSRDSASDNRASTGRTVGIPRYNQPATAATFTLNVRRHRSTYRFQQTVHGWQFTVVNTTCPRPRTGEPCWLDFFSKHELPSCTRRSSKPQ